MRVMSDAVYTMPAILARAVARRGNQPALGFIRGGEIHWRTWNEIAADAAQVATLLRTAGLAPGDRVAQVSENRYEWILSDLAIHFARGVHVPMHVSLAGEQIADQIDDCAARFLFVSSAELLAKFRHRVGPEVHVFLHGDEQGQGRRIALLGEPAVAPEIQRANHSPQPKSASPDDLATILYTSGTTGRPRGVMLSQRNLATNAAATAEALGGSSDDTWLCVLPLSHIFARTCDMYCWLYCGARLVLAESRETLARDLQLARPTIINGVPYSYQKIAEQIRAEHPRETSAALKHFFGGRMQILNSGGAALSPETEAWYAELGLPLLRGYGLTEASPVVSASTPTANRPGSVGRAIPGVEIRTAADSEILVRGPNVMLGYWNDEAATREAVRDGWLYTGDLGQIDTDGYLFIRGRKKEIIVLSTGKNVLPGRVENLLAASPLIAQAAVFGDGRQSLVALVVPAEIGLTNRERMATEISRCLKCAAHEEQVRNFAIVNRPFSIERGELTPKMSLCRTTIAANFAGVLAKLESSTIEPPRHDELKAAVS